MVPVHMDEMLSGTKLNALKLIKANHGCSGIYRVLNLYLVNALECVKTNAIISPSLLVEAAVGGQYYLTNLIGASHLCVSLYI